MRTAKRIVLSHGSDRSERDRAALEDSTFQSSLRRAHDSASEGDVWEEFLGTGCDSTQDVVLRVEHVEGGPNWLRTPGSSTANATSPWSTRSDVPRRWPRQSGR